MLSSKAEAVRLLCILGSSDFRQLLRAHVDLAYHGISAPEAKGTEEQLWLDTLAKDFADDLVDAFVDTINQPVAEPETLAAIFKPMRPNPELIAMQAAFRSLDTAEATMN